MKKGNDCGSGHPIYRRGPHNIGEENDGEREIKKQDRVQDKGKDEKRKAWIKQEKENRRMKKKVQNTEKKLFCNGREGKQNKIK